MQGISKITTSMQQTQKKTPQPIVQKIKPKEVEDVPQIPYYQEYYRNSKFNQDRTEYLIVPPTNTIKFTSVNVGNSDVELSASDDQVITFSPAQVTKPKPMTIQCSDTSIKGDQLIWVGHQTVSRKIERVQMQKQILNVIGGNDWLAIAGKMAVSQSDIEKKDTCVQEIQVGLSKLQLSIKVDKQSERLNLPKGFIKSILPEISENKTDLTWAEISIVTSQMRKQLNTNSKQIAVWQLMQLQGKDVAEIKDNCFKQWLDFLNAMMFGVESSRVNNTYLTGLMTLELIKDGHLTYQKAFHQDEYGGQFPMASNQTGPKNFTARRRLLEHQEHENSAGMAIDRALPQWCAITLKEAIITKNWLKTQKVLSREQTKTENIKAIALAFSQLMDKYFIQLK